MSFALLNIENKNLYKYLPLSTTEQLNRLLEILKKGQIYCCPIMLLNDPMEAFIDFSDPNIRDLFDLQDRKNTYVCSMSHISPLTPESILMWVHYCRDFTGVCLEVEVLEDKCDDMCRCDVKYLPNLKEAFAELKELRDTDQYFSTKLQFWNYEKEVRYILYRKPFDAETPDISAVRNIKNTNVYLPVKIKSIFVGYKSPKYIKDMIIAWCQSINQNMPVERVSKSKIMEILYNNVSN